MTLIFHLPSLKETTSSAAKRVLHTGRLMWKLSVLIVLSALFPSIAHAQDISFPYNRFEYSESFQPGLKEIHLSRKFLIPGSDSLLSSGQILKRDSDYEISYIDGVINLTFDSQDSLIVYYQIFPWSLKKHYFNRTIPQNENQPSGQFQYSSAPSPVKYGDDRIRHSGSIFRSISVGSDRDASLDSGMELKLNGRLGKKTTVSAALSDQNTPLQPEGDTKTLEEIDKVYINVQSENLGANFGDYNMSIEDREFASVNRKLTGVQGFASGENFQAMISAATSKGEFRSINFTGSDGLQGPYQLTGKRGETGILILAGTEKVWVDGILMIRGENYDYIIDYSLGEITFTEKVPITADSRINVDFEYSAGDYSRNYYHSAGKIDILQDRLSLSYALAHEADSKDNPLSTTLTEEVKTALKQSGDSQTGALVPGGDYVGDMEGDYFKIDLTDTTFYYEWEGRDSGDYDVVFSYIGANLGSYEREFSTLGEIYYQYVGEGMGEYDAVIMVPPPSSHELGDFGLDYRFNRNTSLKFEGAASKLDQNTFSGIDDGNNDGYALKAEISADSMNLPDYFSGEQKFGLNLKTRNIDDNFNSIDRTEEAEYNRKWGYSDSLSNMEKSFDFRSYYIPAGGFKLTAGLGSMEKQDFSSFRRDIRFDYSQDQTAGGKIFAEQIDTKTNDIKGFWRRGDGNLWINKGRYTPGFLFRGEDKSQEGGGFRFGEFKPSLKISTVGEILTEYTFRNDEFREENRLKALSQSNTEHVKYENYMTNKDILVDYTHSERDYSVPDSADIVSDLGRLEYNSRMYSGAVLFSFKHKITQSMTAETALIPIEVGWGAGDYVKEGDQYYLDPNGNYLLITEPTGKFTRSSKVKSSANLRIDFRKIPSTIGNLPDVVKLLYTETYFSVDEESRIGDPWKLYVLYLPEFRGDSTLYGLQTFRQDIHYRKGDRNFSVRFRFTDSRNKTENLVNNSIRSLNDDYSVTVWKSLSKNSSINSNNGYRVENKWLAGFPWRELSFLTTDNTINRQVTRSIELHLNLKLENASEKVGQVESNSITIKPQIEYSMINRGRVSLFGGWTGVFANKENIPYEMTAGQGKGSNYEWGMQAGYRLGENLNLTLNYDGESKVGRPVIHTGRMELRANF